MFRLFLVGLLVGTCVAIWQILTAMKKAKKSDNDPHKRLQAIIEVETQKLHAAAGRLRASENYVRQLAREVRICSDDIESLNVTVRKLVSNNNEGQARVYQTSIQRKQKTLEALDDKHKKALEQHEKSVETVESYRTMIRDLKQQANDLQVRVDLAEVERQAAALGADIDVGLNADSYQQVTEEIEQIIRQSNAEATLDRHLIEAAKPELQFEKAFEQVEADKQIEHIKIELQRRV